MKIYLLFKDGKFNELFFGNTAKKKIAGSLDAKKIVKEDLTPYEIFELDFGQVNIEELKKLTTKKDIIVDESKRYNKVKIK